MLQYGSTSLYSVSENVINLKSSYRARLLVAGIFSVLSGSVLLLLLPYCCQT